MAERPDPETQEMLQLLDRISAWGIPVHQRPLNPPSLLHFATERDRAGNSARSRRGQSML